MPLDLAAMLFFGELQRAALRADLPRVEWLVSRHFNAIEHVHLGPGADPSAFLLVDVRESREFAVSHLPGAVRLDPDASDAQALQLIRAHRAGRPVLFYCSVGVRSSELAQRLQKQLAREGAHSANLAGGIFGWAKQGRALESANGPTRRVHGYDETWARLAPAPVVLDPESNG